MKLVLSLVPPAEWKVLDYISFDSKINYLTKFAKEKLSELSTAFDKEKEKEKSSSYVERVSLKILDNLQLNFSNIHIRIEDFSMSPSISFGLTLQNLTVINTDDDWNQVFIDRNECKKMDIYKLLTLSNFGLFINLNDSIKLCDKQPKAVEEKMSFLFSEKSEHVKDYEYLIKPGNKIFNFFY